MQQLFQVAQTGDNSEKADSIGFSGIIVSLPNTSSDFSVGDEVYGVFPALEMQRSESFSDYLLVPLSSFSRKPAGLSFDEAAALPIAGCCAYQCLYECVQVTEGHRILIFGGDTAVGSLSIGLAKKAGSW